MLGNASIEVVVGARGLREFPHSEIPLLTSKLIDIDVPLTDVSFMLTYTISCYYLWYLPPKS
jgi:hypothetical protein